MTQRLLLNIALLGFFTLPLTNPSTEISGNEKHPPTRYSSSYLTAQDDSFRQGFNMRVWLNNRGVFGQFLWGNESSHIGLEYPESSRIEHLFGGGLWLGAIIDTGVEGNQKRVMTVSTAYEGWGGPLYEFFGNPDGRDSFFVTDMATTNARNHLGADDDGDGRIDEDEFDGRDNDRDGLTDEDYGAVSHRDAYVAYADTNRRVLNHVPLRAGVWQKTYAWKMGSAADAIIIIDYLIINGGPRVWDSVFVGFMMDADVGPVDVSGYHLHNYAAYDDSTLTAYVDNVLDAPSTPMGISLLPDETDTDMQCRTFASIHTQTFGDPWSYTVMSGCHRSQDEFGWLSDARILTSIGHYQSVQPRDSIRIRYALVSGKDIPDMINNARRAKRIVDHGWFLMPVAEVQDGGDGRYIRIRCTSPDRSPYGEVVEHIVCIGSEPGVYADSVAMYDQSLLYSSVRVNRRYYISVIAVDDLGNRSAPSDEMMIIPQIRPHIPLNLRAADGETSITITWEPNTDLDFMGYRLYRRTSEAAPYMIVSEDLLSEPSFVDGAVRGDYVYRYVVTAVDSGGRESKYSKGDSASLIAPAAPWGLMTGPGKDFIRCQWEGNRESDLRGYDVYRSEDSLSGYLKLNDAPITGRTFVDESVVRGVVYYFAVKAVDATGAHSPLSTPVEGHTVPMDKGIFVVTYAGAREAFYRQMLVSYNVTLDTMRWGPAPYLDPWDFYQLGNYSTFLWLNDGKAIPPPPKSLQRYMLGGGNVVLAGKVFIPLFDTGFPDRWKAYLDTCFCVSSRYPSYRYGGGFSAAIGSPGYPALHFDAIKLPDINYAVIFSTDCSEHVIYRFHGEPPDTLKENAPIGITARDPDRHAVFLSFSLYTLKEPGIRSLLTKILNDFGEVTTVGDRDSIPSDDFELQQTFPNPANPLTTISFTIPVRIHVDLTIYNVLGQKIMTLVDEVREPGRYSVTWHAVDVPSGVYFCRLSGASFSDVRKVVLVR